MTKSCGGQRGTAFCSLFAEVYGTADPAGRSAENLPLSLKHVQEALQKYLALD